MTWYKIVVVWRSRAKIHYRSIWNCCFILFICLL